MNEIIVVEQLPVIKQRLIEVKTEVQKRVEEALTLVCTEETVKDVKEARANLRKEFEFWEDKRKEVKKAVLTPYDSFESVYKDCISTTYRNADNELKAKIDEVETFLKEEKKKEIVDYFDEYRQKAKIDFLGFENCGVNVSLSASKKSLKEQIAAFLDKVTDDLALIDTQEFKDEILYNYKNPNGAAYLNVGRAITIVIEKNKAIEAAKAKEEETKAADNIAKEAEAKVEEIIVAPPIVEEEVLTVAFEVTDTITRLKALKEFLIREGYKYKSI